MRLFSYNIHKGIGGRDRRYRLDRIMAVIEAQNPDIVFLQEVARGSRRSRFDDQPRLLAGYFRAVTHLFQTTVRYTYGGYGNLLLCRWPVEASHQISLQMRRRKPRGAQLVIVTTPEGPMHLAHWHLGLTEKERHWQANHLLGHRLFRHFHHLPTLLAGDTNDWRNTLAKAVLARNGFAHVTHPISRFRSFPAWLPVGSLDKIFVRGAVAVRAARVIRTRLAKSASDHLPLVVDFHLRAGG
ncbi:MAG: endonuclease [Planctomycetes bacterium RBG_16_64_10]|nr:MAG: endonuclease [Planctomycetes bacterium RBG_16_64_10]